MERVKIGICIPGEELEQRLPSIKKMGFESISIMWKAPFPKTDLLELSKRTNEMIGDSGIEVSSLGFYGNPIELEEDRNSLEYIISCAQLFHTNVIGTFSGAVYGKPVTESIQPFCCIFKELAKKADAAGIKIAFENCLQGGNWNYATRNIAFHPKAWEMMFDGVPADNLGLEWEPAHQMAQLIDPVKQLEEWAGRVFHVHGKDAVIDGNFISKYGVSGTGYIAKYRNPGFGTMDWKRIVEILKNSGYQGSISIEEGHDIGHNEELDRMGRFYSLEYLKGCREAADINERLLMG